MVHMLKAGGLASSSSDNEISYDASSSSSAQPIDFNNNHGASVCVPLEVSHATVFKSSSPESSDGSQKSFQFCRICHEGEASSCSEVSPTNSTPSSGHRSREPLVAPCHCTGSVAMVHLSCLEHWLTMSSSDRCELCHYVYETKRQPRTWTEFLTDTDNQFNVRNMIADIICFFLLSPLLVISTYLCAIGAHEYYMRERWEAFGLVFLSVFLLAVYFTWCHVTLKYHFAVWQVWVRTHQRVYITFPVRHVDP